MSEYRDRVERELKNTTRRVSRQKRKKSIARGALNAAKEHGIHDFTLNQVAEYSGCKPSTVSYYFGGVTNLRSVIMLYSRDNKIKWIADQVEPDVLMGEV